ncbi:hypothetical protein MPSEU_000423000 [Mayamaea pseudoterrestris]|nr:hypothetical protein MPSEU_000423000 [Mayamaea pseudoterrestris]
MVASNVNSSDESLTRDTRSISIAAANQHDAAPENDCHDYQNNISCNYQSANSYSLIFQNWLNESAWPGLGLFGESYMLFSLGLLQPLWRELMPSCFDTKDECSINLIQSLTYSVIIGVMCGMVGFGLLANRIGRRIGSIATASLMATGAIGLTLVSMLLVSHPKQLVQCMVILLFVFGIGVGGEYPLSASSASERTMEREQQAAVTEARRQQSTREHDGIVKHNDENATTQNRGRAVQLVFCMQGVGIFCNSLVMMVLLLLTGQTSGAEYYDKARLQIVWSCMYGIGAVVLTYVLVSRCQHLSESQAWQTDKDERELQLLAASASMLKESEQQASAEITCSAIGKEQHQDYDDATLTAAAAAAAKVPQHHASSKQRPPPPQPSPSSSSVSSLSAPSVAVPCDEHDENDAYVMLNEAPMYEETEHGNAKTPQASTNMLLLQHFGVRLFGVSFCWMLWDVAFYGNKLFQSTFILALTGQETTSLWQFAQAATLNSLVALCGYFGAALLLDHEAVGRFRLQLYGFLLTGVLFVSVGFSYDTLSPTLLVVLYLGSSFFGQLGPNATTFLIPAEIFPTQVRTTCHGVAAASGKLGALLASVAFHRVSVLHMFLLSGYASFVACAITYWTIPESNGLDLMELDRKWRCIIQSGASACQYVGPANDAKFLSTYERQKLLQKARRKHAVENDSQLEGIYDW